MRKEGENKAEIDEQKIRELLKRIGADEERLTQKHPSHSHKRMELPNKIEQRTQDHVCLELINESLFSNEYPKNNNSPSHQDALLGAMSISHIPMKSPQTKNNECDSPKDEELLEEYNEEFAKVLKIPQFNYGKRKYTHRTVDLKYKETAKCKTTCNPPMERKVGMSSSSNQMRVTKSTLLTTTPNIGLMGSENTESGGSLSQKLGSSINAMKSYHTQFTDNTSQYEPFTVSRAADHVSISTHLSHDICIEDYDKYTPLGLSKKLFEVINKAREGSIISLPPRHITVPYLELHHPIQLKGCPGSLLEIKNGSIKIKLLPKYQQKRKEESTLNLQRASPTPTPKAPNRKVIFSECSIVFNIQLNNNLGKNKNNVGNKLGNEDNINYNINYNNNHNYKYIPLVRIEDESYGEFRDCDIRAVRSRDGVYILPHVPTPPYREVGFSLGEPHLLHQYNEYNNTHTNTKTPLILPTTNPLQTGGLSLKSCILTHFYHAVYGNVNSTVNIEKCHISECRGSAIEMVNPKALRVANSLISKGDKEGIRVLWNPTSNYKEKIRSILIEGCDFSSNRLRGIHIMNVGGRMSDHNLKINISNNRIRENGGDGIHISGLVITNLEIEDNELKSNSGTCIWIEYVHQKSNKYKFKLTKNSCLYSVNGFGIFLHDFGGLLSHNVVMGNKEGGVIIKGTPRPQRLSPEDKKFLLKYPMKIEIANCQINQNLENGIVVQEYWKGGINIEETHIVGNEQNGLYLVQSSVPNHPSQPTLPGSGRRCIQQRANCVRKEDLGLGGIFITRCNVAKNMANGLSLIRVLCYLSNTIINQNALNAIYIDKEENKGLLHFNDTGKVNSFVLGPIGGPWGLINLPKGGICGRKQPGDNGVCAIF